MKRVIICGAAGRDFHNFNVFFRKNPNYKVVAFTATQLPNIAGRVYPKELAGEFYSEDIPIYPEEMLEELIERYNVDIVVFSYSDVSHEHVMHLASRALSKGCDFWLLGPKSTMLKSKKPVISVCASRTGSGKSPTMRLVSKILKEMGYNVVIVRHPMPYGDLRKQEIIRIEKLEDFEKYDCTIEEREDIEPHIRNGFVVYEGVDYEKILRMAEEEADIILWDGGNNDFPFFYPDLHIVVVDPLRAGHELRYHPGETNVRMADVVIISKENTASLEQIETVRKNVKRVNPRAIILDAVINIFVDKPELIKGRSVLVIEDGPTVTHGEMGYGAGYIAAIKFGAREIIDPEPYAVGSIREVFEKYKHLKNVLPAVGYGREQMRELEETINSTPAETVIIATPSDISRYIGINKEVVRVSYEMEIIGKPKLKDVIEGFLKGKTTKKG